MTGDKRAQLLDNARQIAAIFTAFMLPISTSLQAIGITIVAILSVELIIREPGRLTSVMSRPAVYLPIALVMFVLVGVTWSPLPLADALKWVGPYAKLLLIPLLIATAFTPAQTIQIGLGFLAGCCCVLIISYASILFPTLPVIGALVPGIPFKDNAVQTEMFALCIFGLLVGASWLWNRDKRRYAFGVVILALLFFANIFLIKISRTGLLVALSLPAMLLVYLTGWRRALLIGMPIILIGTAVLWSMPAIKERIAEISNGLSVSTDKLSETSTASRIDFWTKAVSFIQSAPLFGHGTGSIRSLYQSREATNPSPYGAATADPHNQFLHTVLQIGLIGGAVLLAMWASHALLFLNRSIVGMFGLANVWLNVLGSLFNSHISQVTQGMLYCMAVGILGALALDGTKHPKRMTDT